MTVAFCGGLGYVQQRGEASGGGCKSADSNQALLLVMGGSSPPAEPKSSIDGQEHLMGCFSSSNPHYHQKAPISPKFPRNHLVAAARLQHCFCTSGGWKSNAKRIFFNFFYFFSGCARSYHRQVCVQCKTTSKLFYKWHKPPGAGRCSEVIKSLVPVSGILCQGVSVPAPHPAPLLVISKPAPCSPT